jgi:hypothetical protein
VTDELEPVGDADAVRDIDLVAAALRVDRADVDTLVAVLTESLGELLPSGMVEVERERSMGDRLAGRPGHAVAVAVRAPERELSLRRGRHGPVAEIRVVVRGVVISRREVGIDEWTRALAEEVSALARRDAAARTALQRFLSAG